MLAKLDDYDWEEAFKYATSPEAAQLNATISCSAIAREGVSRIIATVDGENDELDWVGVFELADGRFASLRAGCDYTGWG